MTLDIIGAVERCYSCARGDDEWLAGILDALSGLDHGRLGLIGEVFRVSPDGVLLPERRIARPAVHEGFFQRRDRTFPTAMLAVREPVVFASTRGEECGVRRETIDFHRCFGAEDGVGIFAADPSGRTILVSSAIVARHPLAPRTLHQLTLFSAHLAAASRLRAATVGDATADAVLDGSGRVLDVPGAARVSSDDRRTLTDAVRRMDRARGALRRMNPDEALELWHALVDGTWSLVEICESDGKRYILAHHNRPGIRDPKALTDRERAVVAFAAMGHQNKFIAYELGVSASAVAEHLRSAERKLGLASRSELVRVIAPMIRELRSTAG